MNVRSIRAALVIAGASLLFSASALTAHATPAVDVVASNFKFTPAVVEAHVGQETTLRLTSSGGVHGIASSDLGISQTVIGPGKFVTVSFTPKKAGTYVLHCTVICGPGHEAMALTIKVDA